MLSLIHHNFTTYKKETKSLLFLAMPMLLAQVAQMGTGFVDTVMAGGAGKEHLAAVALGSSLFITIFITFAGVMTALNTILSQQFGQKSTKAIGETARQGLWLGIFLGVMGMLMMWAIIPIFKQQFALSADTLKIMGDYIFYVSFAMPAAMIYKAFMTFCVSLDKPKIITVVSWLCFFINIPLNYIFVYGKLGMPTLGGAGCGLATAIVSWLGAIILAIYIIKNHYFADFDFMSTFSLPNLSSQKELLKLGLPIGLSFFIEVSLFTCIMFLVAKLDGDTENFVAAQQIVINTTSLIYMIPQSIGVAATARVGFSLGRRQFAIARYVSGVAVSFAMAIALITATILLIFNTAIARIYTDDDGVIVIAATLMIFAAAFSFADSAQCVASYALRGYKITKLPMLIHIVAFWGFGLLVGYYLAFVGGLGIYGFWWALILSLVVAAVALVWYLDRHSHQVLTQNKIRIG